MEKIICSPIIWEYGMKYDDELISYIVPKDGEPPLVNLTVDTIDLSEYLKFDFYDPVWYWDKLSGEKGEAFFGGWLRISN